jgi:hypothetical protein
MSKGLRLLFLSYWSAEEPLVRSTIVPYLRLMSKGRDVQDVWLITVERGGDPHVPGLEGLPGVHHIAVPMRNKGRGLWSKVELFVRLFLLMRRMVREKGIHVLDSKGALAGGMAYLVHRSTGVPYIVESFEPHSEYMADSGTWSRKGLYYKVASWLEQKQRLTARFLITVTRNYATFLVQQGVPRERVRVVPSITDMDLFHFDAEVRTKVRAEHGWTDAVVGIYVGKFGGLYYDEEAFAIFKRASDVFGPSFRLVLLTSASLEHVERRLAEVGLERDRVTVLYEDHDRVPQWLSASDIAFSTIRYAPNGLYQSPVKNGEYWANGLPVLLCTGVSDDYLIIHEHPFSGAVFDLSEEGSVDTALFHLKELLRKGVDRGRIMELAHEHRSIGIAERVYADVFGTIIHEVRSGGRAATHEAP